MGALTTLVILLVVAAFVAGLGYLYFRRRQSSASDLPTANPTKDQHPGATAAPPTPAPVAPVEKPASVVVPMSTTTDTTTHMPTPSPQQHDQPPQQDIPAVVQSYQQLQQAVSAPISPVDQPQVYPPVYPPQQLQLQPQPTFNAPLELPILPPSPPPNDLSQQSIMGPSTAHLSHAADGPILPTSTPPPQLPVLSTTTSSLLAVPNTPSLVLTPPTLSSPIPSDPTGWPAPGLESFAQAWHAHPYIHGARTARQPFISHSHDELAVSIGDRIVVTLVFSDGWGLGYRVGPGDLPLTNVTEGVFPLCVLQPEVGDDALVALERDLIARQQKQMAEAAQAQAQAQAQEQQQTYYVSLPRAVEGSGSLPSLPRSLGTDEPPVNVVGEGDDRAFQMPPEIAVQVDRGASLARRQK